MSHKTSILWDDWLLQQKLLDMIQPLQYPCHIMNKRIALDADIRLIGEEMSRVSSRGFDPTGRTTPAPD